MRYFCQLLNGSFTLPSKDVMRDHTRWDLEKRLAQGWSMKRAHEFRDPLESEYIEDLAEEAGTTSVPVVVNKLKRETVKNMLEDFMGFREHNFRVIDDETFEEIS